MLQRCSFFVIFYTIIELRPPPCKLLLCISPVVQNALICINYARFQVAVPGSGCCVVVSLFSSSLWNPTYILILLKLGHADKMIITFKECMVNLLLHGYEFYGMGRCMCLKWRIWSSCKNTRRGHILPLLLGYLKTIYMVSMVKFHMQAYRLSGNLNIH